MNKKEIMEALRSCKHCHSGEYKPFFFSLKNQEVMIITAAPSIQAMYKPLTSVRFFRKLCIALFGDKYLNENYIMEFCDGNIYWTHYYKCFSTKDLSDLNSLCAKKYLKNEIKALKNLKLIIVFGDAIKDKVQHAISEVATVNTIYVDFPKTGAECEFEPIRFGLKPYINFMKNDSQENYITGQYVYNIDNQIGYNVHMNFELQAYKKLISGIDDKSMDIEAVWHEKLVIPNMKRYMQVVLAHTFIENQIRVFLTDSFVDSKEYTILKKFRDSASGKTPSLSDVMSELEHGWKNGLVEYAKYKNFEKAFETQTLKNEIEKLSKIRNCIVHNGGFIKSEQSELLPGIYAFVNTLYVTEDANLFLTALMDNTVDMLKSY